MKLFILWSNYPKPPIRFWNFCLRVNEIFLFYFKCFVSHSHTNLVGEHRKCTAMATPNSPRKSAAEAGNGLFRFIPIIMNRSWCEAVCVVRACSLHRYCFLSRHKCCVSLVGRTGRAKCALHQFSMGAISMGNSVSSSFRSFTLCVVRRKRTRTEQLENHK